MQAAYFLFRKNAVLCGVSKVQRHEMKCKTTTGNAAERSLFLIYGNIIKLIYVYGNKTSTREALVSILTFKHDSYLLAK